MPDCRISLTGEEDRLILRIASLRTEENRDVTLRVPDGFRPVETDVVTSSADGGVRLRLAGFGVRELFLRRGEPQQADD